MKKLILIVLCIFLIVNISCKKEKIDNVDYPIELVFSSLDIGEGVSTFTHEEHVESSNFNENELSIDEVNELQFPESIIIESNNSAKFIFSEDYSDCDKYRTNLCNQNVSIYTEDDFIIFRYDWLDFFTDYPSIGKLNEKLEFPGCITYHVERNGTTISYSKNIFKGSWNFEALIENLGIYDKFSIIEYKAIYELK